MTTKQTTDSMKDTWERSFAEQVTNQAYNTAPVEALARSLSYYLRGRVQPDRAPALHFLEMGCGAGPNLVWLAQKGIKVSAVDIAPTALDLARRNLVQQGFGDRIGQLREASVSAVPFEDGLFDGIIEACVFQHLDKRHREQAFAEVNRLLKPGGVFVGYMLDVGHTVYRRKRAEELPEDAGTLILKEGGSHVYLTNLGVSHFFHKEEILGLLRGFTVVDPCLTTYYLPAEEAQRRGYDDYLQSMWTVYAIK
jgi:SAM-dependent methyltransferase